MGKPVNVEVKLGGKIRTTEQMIKKFKRKCKESGILEEYREKTLYHKTKSQKRRDKKAAAIRRARAKQNKKQQKLPRRK
jgi:ribosomal protein S21